MPTWPFETCTCVLRKSMTWGVNSYCIWPVSTDRQSQYPKRLKRSFPECRISFVTSICLRDIGKDILDPAYGKLRNRLRSHSITTNLSALVKETRQAVCEQSLDTMGPGKISPRRQRRNTSFVVFNRIRAGSTGITRQTE